MSAIEKTINNKMKVLIADDEPEMRLVVRKALSRFDDIEIVGETDNGAKAVQLVEQLLPDCVFLDVEMPAMDGMTAAKLMVDISPKIILVFITAHQQYMPTAFELYAFDYMIKPFKLDRFNETITRIKTVKNMILPKTEEKKLSFKTKDGIVFLAPSEIVLIQRENRATVIITEKQKHVVNENMSEIEEMLPADVFMRSHKSYIINIKKVKRLLPYGRWTFIAEFDIIAEDALVTSEKAKELEIKKG